jgi:dihydroxyacetone kinase
MQKLINRPDRVVDEMLDGLLVLYPGVARLSHHNVVVRNDAEEARDRQIAVISGGGSGHEPAHAGYVGHGMLSAAVAGEVFTSPSVDSIVSAIRAVTGRLGVLLIVKNYTGDRLNFGLAAEIARSEGLLVETVLVADDVALAANVEYAGRRGIAGTVLVHKIAGAAAAEGKDLPQVASIAQAAADNLGTMGVSLSAGTAPGVGKPSFTLDGEVELGLGIHGEPGVKRIPLRMADEMVGELLGPIERAMRLRTDERVAVLLNNLGATTNMELAIIARKVLSVLQGKGYSVERVYAGTFVSSLDMAGVSISLLRVNDERLRWLDAPTAAPAWPRAPKVSPGDVSERIIASEGASSTHQERSPETPTGERISRSVLAACEALLGAEEQLTELDRIAGDGDLGGNMARAARSIKERMGAYSFDHPPQALRELGLSLQQLLGGSSGPLYGVFFLRAGAGLDGGSLTDPRVWAAAMVEACGAISELGGATLGDRTMLDALLPFAQTFDEQLRAGTPVKDALFAAFEVAKRGAQNTANMTARRGRSSYLGARVVGTPDPGAVAVIVWLRAVVGALG